MSANAKVVKPVTGNSTLVRPRFSPGLLLRDDDLRQGVDYTRELSRMLFRSLFGCGVVCGLKVEPDFKCKRLYIRIAPGVALDCYGDPIHVPSPQEIAIDPSCGHEIPPRMCVILRRTETCCAPRNAECSCDDEDTPAVCTRERDGFEIRIVKELPHCVCSCHPAAHEPEPVPAPAPPPPPPPPPQVPGTPRAADAQLSTKANPKKKGTAIGTTTDYQQETPASASEPTDKCWCADPTSSCYADHYQGVCGCDCANCDCEWVVLACIADAKAADGTPTWKVDHSVRRFVRPVLMRDPVAWAEANPSA